MQFKTNTASTTALLSFASGSPRTLRNMLMRRSPQNDEIGMRNAAAAGVIGLTAIVIGGRAAAFVPAGVIEEKIAHRPKRAGLRHVIGDDETARREVAGRADNIEIREFMIVIAVDQHQRRADRGFPEAGKEVE